MSFLGIDPGRTGGYCLLGEKQMAERMPLDKNLEIDCAYLSTLILENNVQHVVIEKVWGAKAFKGKGGGDGEAGVSGSFKFGDGFGQLKGMCKALFVSYELVAPMTWKGRVLGNHKASKEDAMAFVEANYPWVDLMPGRCRKRQDGIADSVCLAHYHVMTQAPQADF